MGDHYPFFPAPSSTTTTLATTVSSSSLWHRRLGHLGHAALSKLISSNAFYVISTLMITFVMLVS
jgi:hypothetical protein